ncbi:UNKNOWN [Stylonychia lemnae]|uniref:Uncharacterized protein n=1 Tax=Stylonychia lemnae TaxID=5949 RepID=A0A078AEV2_STYLE|nr:UNKNOWN [Stylonychia lemnae]|eukprot:CDW80799.1 UNKNOWN [Stylonychia lemnae]
MSKEKAPHYYPPNKRKEFKDHLSKSSIKFNQQPLPHEIQKATDIMYFHAGKFSGSGNFVSTTHKAFQNNQKFVVNRDMIDQQKNVKKNANIVQQLSKRPSSQQNIIVGTARQQGWWEEQHSQSKTFLNIYKQNPSTMSTQNFKLSKQNQNILSQNKELKIQSKLLQRVLKKTNFRVGSHQVDFKTVKQAHQDDQTELKFKEYIAEVDPKCNKKNVSKVVFDARITMSQKLQERSAQKYNSLPRQGNQQKQLIEIYQPDNLPGTSNDKKQEILNKVYTDKAAKSSGNRNQALQQHQFERSGKRLFDKQPTNIPLSQKQSFIVYNPDLERPKTASNQNTLMFVPAGRIKQNPQSVLDTRYEQIQEEIELAQKLKSQNFHITGPRRDRPYTALEMNEKRGQTVSNERPSTQNHYRTSFQESFFNRKIQDYQNPDAIEIKNSMKIQNVQPLINRTARSLSGVKDYYQKDVQTHERDNQVHDPQEQTNYDNINFKNHLPFKEELRYQNTRFKTQYNQFHKNGQSKERLLETYDKNNTLNKLYSERELAENHNLGIQTKEELLNTLNTEHQVGLRRTQAHQMQIEDEYKRGLSAMQLRPEFKELINRQNCTYKQAIISGGDVFLDDKKLAFEQGKTARQIESNQQIDNNAMGLEYNVVDHKLRQTLSAQDFKGLNFKDQMINHRVTNFMVGSHINIQTDYPQVKAQLIKNPTQVNLQLDQRPQSQLITQTDQRYLLRPQTAQIVNRQITLSSAAADKIKMQHKSSKVVMGNDREAHKVKTDYRNNFVWTIPKFAM